MDDILEQLKDRKAGLQEELSDVDAGLSVLDMELKTGREKRRKVLREILKIEKSINALEAPDVDEPEPLPVDQQKLAALIQEQAVLIESFKKPKLESKSDLVEPIVPADDPQSVLPPPEPGFRWFWTGVEYALVPEGQPNPLPSTVEIPIPNVPVAFSVGEDFAVQDDLPRMKQPDDDIPF